MLNIIRKEVGMDVKREDILNDVDKKLRDMAADELVKEQGIATKDASLEGHSFALNEFRSVDPTEYMNNYNYSPQEDDLAMVDANREEPKNVLEKLPPEKLIKLLEKLTPEELEKLLEKLPPEEREKILERLEKTIVEKVLQVLQEKQEKIGKLLEKLPPEELKKLLGKLPSKELIKLIEKLPPKEQRKLIKKLFQQRS
jgi:Mg/Co/Ni transporter MgtE